ncbi:uncharacterized protein LOC133312332 [Gastrolobium bilobum]|uniref:uncharacterized protein LOC133312332 n=1 Tax=Gastrolobium bilobum TaxID=150636 RepID=UPI002AAF5C15|nr:uncharacterized protein LOC133312332 [Gastrolobium bilobum]
MRGKANKEPLQFDPEIEKTAKKNRKLTKLRKIEESSSSEPKAEPEMTANNLPPSEEEFMESILAPQFTRPNSSIIRPPINANNFDIQPTLITLVEKNPFGGEDYEEPYDFIDRFLRICDTTKHNGVSDDAIRLRLFPFAVTGKALRWLDRQAPNSIRMWDELAAKFFAEHFSREKYNKLVNEITNFTQQPGETLCAAWTRFQELIRRCPAYDLPDGKKVRIFYNGMTPDSRMVVNGAADGTIARKTTTQTLELIDFMARAENASMTVQPVQPRMGILQLGNNDASLAEPKILSQQIASLNAKLDKLQLSIAQVDSVNYCKSIVTRSEIVITPQEKLKVVQKKKADEPVLEPEIEKEEETPAKEDKEEAKEKAAETPKKQWDFSRFEKPPYPIKSRQAKKKQHARFLEIFKKFQINIPFAEALANMPNYAKFMKELLSRKHKLQECETVALTEECNAIIHKKFPPKLQDPGSFNIPIAIGNIDRALCDLGASINLMPLSVMKSLKIFELKPTTLSLELADRTLRSSNGVIEDVLVKVDKFIFPADFVVLDMEEEGDMPLLLGRPFLATVRAMIDVEKRKLELRMDNEKVTIDVFKVMKHAEDNGDCFRVDVLEALFLEKEDD